MISLNKKIFLAALSSVFFSSASYATHSDENRDLEGSQRVSHSIPNEVIEAVEENKQRLLRNMQGKRKLIVSQYPYGMDDEGRAPGDKNYGAAESDSLIELLISKKVQYITWGVKDFKAMSPSEMNNYMRAINYTELW